MRRIEPSRAIPNATLLTGMVAILGMAAASAAPTAGDVGEVPRTLTIAGRVLDPSGRPVPGARLYLVRPGPDTFQWRHRGKAAPWQSAPPARATTGPDGRFRFTIERNELASSDSIAAFAEGYGPAWTHDMRIGDPDGLDLPLAADDVPIAGRLIDMEGHSVTGVAVRVIQIDATSDRDLTRWLAEIAPRTSGEARSGFGAFHRFTATLPADLAGLIRPATTGPDGRFRLAGLGRERLVSLLIQGPKIETQVVNVMTRRGASGSVRLSFPDPKMARMRSYENVIHAADFEPVTAPARPVEGFVRDRETGHPLPGVLVRAERHHFASTFRPSYPMIDWPGMAIVATTDEKGHYRLTGLPAREGVFVRAEPAEEQPYHAAIREAGNPPGLDPARLDLELKRGIPVRGRVVDRETGEPVAATVVYHPALDNPNVDRADRGYGDELRPTRPDGRFSLVAYPGPGLVAATALGDRFLTADRTDDGSAAMFPKPGRLIVPAQTHAFAAIRPEASAESCTCDLVLTPGPEPAVRILDADGRPLAGAVMSGIPPTDAAREGWWQSRGEAVFRVTGLTGRRIRVLLIHHEQRRLAGTLAVRDNEPGPMVARLRPWGAVSGRLVDRDGRPRPGVRLSYRGPADVDRGTAPPFPRDVTTDREGRFAVEGLVPGLEYVLRIAVDDGLGPRIGEAHLLEPGEDASLGDVREGP